MFFLICAKFVCTNLCDLFQKSHVEPVVCARRSRILRALIAFSCRQQLIKYRLFTTKTSCFFNAFLTHLRDLFFNRAWSLSSALDAISCKQSLIFACRLSYPAKLHAATACRFCVRPAHRCKNFAGGFVGCVRGFLLPAISASSLAVSSSTVFYNRCLSAAVLFVLVFQLENIVGFLLIHRPYGFIVQFLMINTGNGGSFVQL